MNTVSQVVGPAAAKWFESTPLRWTISEALGEGRLVDLEEAFFDLTPLLPCFNRKFLLAVKERWMEARLRMKLHSIKARAFGLQSVLQHYQRELIDSCHESSTRLPEFDRIDGKFLLGLQAISDQIPNSYLRQFRAFFVEHRLNTDLFHPELRLADFPRSRRPLENAPQIGEVGRIRKNVISSALSRATLVHILNVTEASYESGELNLDEFAYSRLLLSRAARPESFRLFRLKDLLIDEIDGKKAYFLRVTIPKAKTATPPVATIRLHPDVGFILDLQRQSVANRLSVLIEGRNSRISKDVEECARYTVGDLPLFPVLSSSNRMYQTTKARLGMMRGSGHFANRYLERIRKLTNAKLNHTALRHTMGTQLAIAGCSASTIAAVLLHANTRTAAVYVDLVLEGAIDELSASLEPAFLAHFPVFKDFVSAAKTVAPEKRIVSPSLDRVRRETTGECGGKQVCHFAPIACYECHRFKPCYDVDHNINLERVNEEINSARLGGLARQADLKRYLHIADRIRLVIDACDAKREQVNAARQD